MTFQQTIQWLIACHSPTPFMDSDMPSLLLPDDEREPLGRLDDATADSITRCGHFRQYCLFLNKQMKPVVWVWNDSPRIIDLDDTWIAQHVNNWKTGRWYIYESPMTISDWCQAQR